MIKHPLGTERGGESGRVPPRQSPSEPPNCKPQKRGYFSKGKNWVSLLTLIAVAAYTAISALILWVQRDQEKRQLRAYVHLVPDQVLNLDAVPLEITWNVKKFGNTPAYHVRMGGQFDIFPPSMSSEEGGSPEKMSTIGPENNFYLPPQSFNGITIRLPPDKAQSLDGPEKTDIRNGDRLLFADGVIIYDDVFGDEHRTTFRLQYGGPDSVRLGLMEWSPKGNEAY
jgi:hypothetical protein